MNYGRTPSVMRVMSIVLCALMAGCSNSGADAANATVPSKAAARPSNLATASADIYLNEARILVALDEVMSARLVDCERYGLSSSQTMIVSSRIATIRAATARAVRTGRAKAERLISKDFSPSEQSTLYDFLSSDLGTRFFTGSTKGIAVGVAARARCNGADPASIQAAVQEEIIKVTRTFSQKDNDDWLKFFSSPAGQKYKQIVPPVTQSMATGLREAIR